MPLIKSPSKKALQENTQREIEAGKPPDQAVAIAHDVQRKARGKRGHSGGRKGR